MRVYTHTHAHHPRWPPQKSWAELLPGTMSKSALLVPWGSIPRSGECPPILGSSSRCTHLFQMETRAYSFCSVPGVPFLLSLPAAGRAMRKGFMW